jgi:hypothetical protein
MLTWTNDDSPVEENDAVVAPPALKPVQETPAAPATPIQPVQKDTTTANNQNIGTPTNAGDYNNNSDV